jgi:hypothetical protein
MKTKKIIIISFMAFIIAAATYACPSQSEFRFTLKKVVFDYLSNPEESVFSQNEIKDMIWFYFEHDDVSTLDCAAFRGNITNAPIADFLIKAEAVSEDTIPTCTDGTFYGECSHDKPRFCYAGMLVRKCQGPDNIKGNSDDCGCDGTYSVCQDDGTCFMPTIKCAGPLDCGVDSDIGEQFCSSGNLYINHIEWRCDDPGTAASQCNYTIKKNLVENCSFGCEEDSCLD